MGVIVSIDRNSPKPRRSVGMGRIDTHSDSDHLKKVLAIKQLTKALKPLGFEIVLNNEDGTIPGPDEFTIRRQTNLG